MIDEIKAYILKNNLHEKAIEAFWISFKNWKKEYPKKYLKIFKNIPMDSLDIFVHTVGLRSSQWPECNYSHVTISVLIQYKDSQLGKYVAWFSLNDSLDDDDFLEIN